MQEGLVFCFEKDTIDGSLLADLFRVFVRFTPVRITHGVKSKKWDQEKSLKVIASDTKGSRFFIGDEEGNDFSIDENDAKSSFRSVQITGVLGLKDIADRLYPFVRHKGFISAYLFNTDYEYVQSTKFSNNYEGRGFSKEILESVNDTPWIRGMWGKEYNISFNPGRSVLLRDTWLMIGWKMWFGEPFFKLVSQERILSFPYAFEIERLTDSVVYIKLFEKIDEPYTSDSVLRQWQWREWADYTGLEKTLV